jgi:LmbE family N-acetylglucosaminyl deacetylase
VINTSTRDVLENANNNTRAILDFLTNDKIENLRAENQALKFQASQTAQNAFITANQEAQTAELIRRLGADCPTPAYVVQPPTPVTFPVNNCGCGFGNSYGYGYAG